MKKTWGVECAVKWCVCLTKAESQYCAVHFARGQEFRVEELAPGELRHESGPDCAACGGEGTCEVCDGAGTHYCHTPKCDDEHDCRPCDGSGDCRECRGTGKASATVVISAEEKRERRRRRSRGQTPELTFEERYIAFAFDAGWVPPVPYESPWDVA